MRLAIFLSLCAAATLPAFPSTDRSLRIPASFGKELLFEVNQGQAPTQVQFLARNPSYTLLLAPSTATLLFKKAANASPLAIHFERSNPAAIASGLAPSPAKINYFSGSEASTWRTNINTYRKVRYASLYPGIDLVFYGKGNFLEYDLLVEPGADPAKIALSFGSSILPSIAANGDLVLPLATGELRCHSPLLYQPGPHSTAISGKYVLHADRTVSFTLGPYDRTKTLVIDPVVTYSSYLGGSDDEGIFGIQRDREGNLYVAGETSSLNFPTADPVQPFEGGDYDAFVSKFDPTGTRLIYSTYLGGSGYDHAVGLAVDPRGDAYVAGLTTSSNFPTKLPLQAVLKGQQNAFVVHLQHLSWRNQI